MTTSNGTENPARDRREMSDRGIKFFRGLSIPALPVAYPMAMSVSADQLRRDHAVWRPEETIEAADILFQYGKIHVIGSPQSGKGTILFGLSEICDREGWGYVFINGHHIDAPTEHVTASIIRANAEGRAIFFDSFDYLWKIPDSNGRVAASQKRRTRSIVDVLSQVAVPVAITSHDEGWAKKFINLGFRSEFENELKAYPVYNLSNYLQSEASVAKFLIDNHLTPTQSNRLLSLEHNPLVVTALVQRYGDKDIVASIFKALRSYPVLKDLTRDSLNEVVQLLDEMEIVSTRDINPQLQLAEIIRSADKFIPFLATLRKKR